MAESNALVMAVQAFLKRKATREELRQVLGDNVPVVMSVPTLRQRTDCPSVRGWDGHRSADVLIVSEAGWPVAVLERTDNSLAAPYSGGGDAVSFKMGDFVDLPISPEILGELKVLYEEEHLKVLEEEGKILALITSSYSWHPAHSGAWAQSIEKSGTTVLVRASAQHRALTAVIEGLGDPSYETVCALAVCEAVLDTRFAWVYHFGERMAASPVEVINSHTFHRVATPFGDVLVPTDSLGARAAGRASRYNDDRGVRYAYASGERFAGKNEYHDLKRVYLPTPSWLLPNEASDLWRREEMAWLEGAAGLAENYNYWNKGEKARIVPNDCPGLTILEVFDPRYGRYLYFQDDASFVAARAGYTTEDSHGSWQIKGDGGKTKYLGKGYYRDQLPGEWQPEGWEFALQLHRALREIEGLKFRVTGPELWTGAAEDRAEVDFYLEPRWLHYAVEQKFDFIRSGILANRWSKRFALRIAGFVRDVWVPYFQAATHWDSEARIAHNLAEEQKSLEPVARATVEGYEAEVLQFLDGSLLLKGYGGMGIGEVNEVLVAGYSSASEAAQATAREWDEFHEREGANEYEEEEEEEEPA